METLHWCWHVASTGGTSSKRTIVLLLEHQNIDVNKQVYHGDTALIRACDKLDYKKRTVSALLAHSTIYYDIKQTISGNSAITLACRYIEDWTIK